jgi:1-deoxyxylulose-5-phosphate synthase
MEPRPLGKSDLKVSPIGMGCVTFGREIDRDTSFAVLDHALASGITLYDTAEAYAAGASENVLGAWMASRKTRERIVLATKVAGPLTPARIIESTEASLGRLKTDRIDLFQLHSWDGDTPLAQTLEALDTLVRQGKVRYIGCSNFMAWQLAKALLLTGQHGLARFESVQPPYNLVQRSIETDLLPLCVDQNIGVISYSPLAAGFLSGKYRRGQALPKGTRFDIMPAHQPIYCNDHGYSVLERLDQIAQRSGRSLVQVALSWILGRPHISSVLIGARNTAQVDQAFAASETPLNEEQIQAFD